MKLVTNPGSNLCRSAVDRYDVHVTPQTIVVDGKAKDTRDLIPFDVVDAWVRTAKVHPYVVGTTAAEFVGMFRELATRDPNILAVMSSRKIIGSHDAALSAAKTLASRPGCENVKVRVADTGVTDVGAGLATILAGEARRAGLALDSAAEVVESYRKHARLVMLPETLEYLVKGGRATAVRAWMANLLQVRPLLAFVDGELSVVEKVSTRTVPAVALASYFVAQLGEGRTVWIAVSHGNADVKAAAVEQELRRRFDVRFAYTKPLAPSIYLHGGPGSVLAAVVPLDVFPFELATPPRL